MTNYVSKFGYFCATTRFESELETSKTCNCPIFTRDQILFSFRPIKALPIFLKKIFTGILRERFAEVLAAETKTKSLV